MLDLQFLDTLWGIYLEVYLQEIWKSLFQIGTITQSDETVTHQLLMAVLTIFMTCLQYMVDNDDVVAIHQ